jgi:hypothetical protein
MKVEGVEGLEQEKVYIGQCTVTLNAKLYRHLTGHGNKGIGLDAQHFGRKVFKIELLAQFPGLSPNNEMEQYYIKLYKDQGADLYNVYKGGGRPSKLSLLNPNELDSTPTLNKLLKVERLKATTKAHYGVDFACQLEEINNKRKATNLQKYGVEEPGLIMAKLVYCYETGKVYPSVSACARELGYSQPNISRAARGLLESVGGLHFTLIENYNNNKDRVAVNQ